jgi:hypothetical protein
MSKYLNYLIEAFQQVDQKYYSWRSIKDFNGKCENQQINSQRLERVFAFELYHQYRKQMEFNSNDFSDLLLNAEPFKSYVYEILANENYFLINSSTPQHSIIPDLVLHKSQDTVGIENQKLTIEIKAQIEPDVKKDINKLLLMADKFDFEYGVFITINSKLEYITNKIKESFDINGFNKDVRKYAELFERIIILNRKSTHEIIFKETLFNLLLE